MLISSFPQPIIGEPGQDVACELKQRYFSLTLKHKRQASWRQTILYTLSCRQYPFSDSLVAKAIEYKVKVKETDPM